MASGTEPRDSVMTRVPPVVRVARERVAEAHEQRCDAAVVARARGAQQRVDVGVEEELGDREPLRACGPRPRDGGQVDEGESRHVAEVPVVDRGLLEQVDDAVLGGRWPSADIAAIRTTSASAASDASRSRGAVAMVLPHEPEGLDEARAGLGSAIPRSAPSTPTTSCSAVAADHRSRVRWASIPVNPPSTTMPRRLPSRRHAAARSRAPTPRARGGSAARRTAGARASGLPRRRTPRRGHGSRRSPPARRRRPAPGRAPGSCGPRVAPRLEGQVVCEAHGIDDRRRRHDGVECGLDPHGAPPSLVAPSRRRGVSMCSG